jgi:hemerythrin
MALRWTTALAIGVAELDAQHEELFRRLDRMLDAMLVHDRTEAVRLLAFLRSYVRDHFATEERLMREAAYPETTSHEAEHERFRAAIADLSRTLETNGASAHLVLRLERELTTWVRDHIYSTDLALGHWLVAREAAAQRDARRGDPTARPHDGVPHDGVPHDRAPDDGLPRGAAPRGAQGSGAPTNQATEASGDGLAGQGRPPAARAS